MKRYCLLSIFIIFFISDSLYAQTTSRDVIRENCKMNKFYKGVWRLEIDWVDDPYNRYEDDHFLGSANYIIDFNRKGVLRNVRDGADLSQYGSTYVEDTLGETEIITGYPEVDGSNYSVLSIEKAEENRACKLSLKFFVKHFGSGSGGTITLRHGQDIEVNGYVSLWNLESGEPDVINLDDGKGFYFNYYWAGSTAKWYPNNKDGLSNPWNVTPSLRAKLTRIYNK